MCFSLILILLTVYSFAKYTAYQRYTKRSPFLGASNQKDYNRKGFYRLKKLYFRTLCQFRVSIAGKKGHAQCFFKRMLSLVHERFVCMLHMNRKRYKSQRK